MERVGKVNSKDRSSYCKTHSIAIGSSDWLTVFDDGANIELKFSSENKEAYYALIIGKDSPFWRNFVQMIREVDVYKNPQGGEYVGVK